jgi:hypothetical protein
MKDAKRQQRIEQLLERLSAGEDVSRRDLSRLLTVQQFQTLDQSWQDEQASRSYAKPPELKKYETLLRTGMLQYSRYEALHKKVDAYRSNQLIEQAQVQLEKALECAVELVESDGSLLPWFDRDPRECQCGDPIGMPRVITSKSFENQSTLRRAPFSQSIRDLKAAALSSALLALQSEELPVAVPKPRTRKDAMDTSGFRF